MDPGMSTLHDGLGETPATPLTSFRCPLHDARMMRSEKEREGRRVIRFWCPVEACDYAWTKRGPDHDGAAGRRRADQG